MNQSLSRILFIGHTAEIGGPTHSLMLLLRYLRQQYDVAVLLPETGPLWQWLHQEGIPVFIIPGLQVTAVGHIYKLIGREKIDLVYGNNPSNCSRNALLAARLAGKPFIWHFRGMKWHWGWRRGFFLRFADRVVAVSHACARSLQRFYPLEEIEVIYNGVDLIHYDHSGPARHPQPREQLGLPPDAHILMSISHLTPRKGHEQAVDVVAHLVQQVENAHLVIAGSLDRDPSYTMKICDLIRDRGLERNIHLLGLRQDVPNLLAGADLFLHTALQDPHPRAVLEAMASGLPVVAFGVDGVAETVIDQQTGQLIAPGDTMTMAQAVAALLADPDKAAEYGRSGQERVRQEFTAACTAQRVGQLIEQLL